MYISVLALDSKRWAYLISQSRSCVCTLTLRGLESKQVCLGFIMRRVVYFPTRHSRWPIPQKPEGKLDINQEKKANVYKSSYGKNKIHPYCHELTDLGLTY